MGAKLRQRLVGCVLLAGICLEIRAGGKKFVTEWKIFLEDSLCLCETIVGSNKKKCNEMGYFLLLIVMANSFPPKAGAATVTHFVCARR